MAPRALQDRWRRLSFSQKVYRVKNIVSSRSILALSVASLLLVSGCSTTTHTRGPAAPAQEAFVSHEMENTIRSVEQSLQVLVDLERGDEGPRRSSALGTTVAGAAGPDEAPVDMPKVAGPDTSIGQERIETNRQQSRVDLNTRVRMTWTGEADNLLRELSRRVGFTFSTSGTGKAPVVHIKEQEATVEQVLREVARQVDASADVKVDTTQRRVILAYKTVSTQ